MAMSRIHVFLRAYVVPALAALIEFFILVAFFGFFLAPVIVSFFKRFPAFAYTANAIRASVIISAQFRAQ